MVSLVLQLCPGELNIHCPWIYVMTWFRSEAKWKTHAYIIERYRVVLCNRFCPIQTLNTCIILWISDTVHTCSNMKEQVYSIIHWFCIECDAKLWMQLSWILAIQNMRSHHLKFTMKHKDRGHDNLVKQLTLHITQLTQNQTNREWEKNWILKSFLMFKIMYTYKNT